MLKNVFLLSPIQLDMEGKEVQTASVRRNLYAQTLEALCRTIMMVAALSACSSAIN